MLSSIVLPLFIAATAPAKVKPAPPPPPTESHTALFMLIGFVATTLVITWFSTRKSPGSSAYFAADRRLTGLQNGLAAAGGHLSAAAFLGISGMIAFHGYDGFLCSVGWFVAWLTVLLIVAEPLRNAGQYTMADLVAYRLKQRPVRALASLSTITVSTFFLIAEMVGAGLLVKLLLPTVPMNWAIIGVGVLTIVYVVFGGMLATTRVQILTAILFLSGTILLSFLVMKYYDFRFARFFKASSEVLVNPKTATTKSFLLPGMLFGKDVILAPNFGPGWGPLDLVSLGLALVFGTAGLPQVLTRFYTVPDAKTARVSVVWAMIIIGLFYLTTTFLGFGAAAILGPSKLMVAGVINENMAAPLLANKLGNELFVAFISAVAFATILAVVAGLIISASTSFAHDFHTNVLHHGKEIRPGDEVKVARITALVIGALAIFLVIQLQTINVAFLVGLAFAVAASAHLPVIVLSVVWRRFTTAGAAAGLGVGLLASLALIIISPTIMGIDAPTVAAARRHLIQHAAIFPLTNPGLVSIPLAFLAAILASLVRRDRTAEAAFAEFSVRANTGLGAEKATAL
ncbi:MAG: cation/acetate symporter [Chthoniobacter sp.]|nr:cation/acetate symporter [Chthoniobacter sp.]